MEFLDALDFYNGRSRIYVDIIMTAEKLSSIKVVYSPVFYWSGRSSSRRGGDEAKRGWGISLFSQLIGSL